MPQAVEDTSVGTYKDEIGIAAHQLADQPAGMYIPKLVGAGKGQLCNTVESRL